MGQIEWFDLIDEVLVTALTVPLYFLLKPDKEKTVPDKNCAAFLVSFAVYTVFTIVVMLKIGSIAKFMNAENAVQYLFMQALSMLAGFAVDIGFTAYNVFDTYRIDYTAHELEHENYSEPEDVLKHI